MAHGNSKASRYAKPETVHNVAALKQMFPFRGYIEQAELRGITLTQLKRVKMFAEACCFNWWDQASRGMSKTAGQTLSMDFLNLYHLTAWLVKPATKDNSCAFVELLSAKPQVPKWFVSHWWGEHLIDFVKCIQRHTQIRQLSHSSPFWVCAYANRLHAASSELTADLWQSSFCKALNVSEGLLLILNRETEAGSPATLFSRTWCAFEQLAGFTDTSRDSALKLDIVAPMDSGRFGVLTEGVAEVDKVLKNEMAGFKVGDRAPDHLWRCDADCRMQSFPLELVKPGLQVEVEKAETTVSEDRQRILNAIAEQEPQMPILAECEKYRSASCRLRATLALSLWRQLVVAGKVLEWKLPEILAADLLRTDVALDFRSCSQMEDDGVGLVSTGIHSSLKRLQLDLAHCKVSDAGLSTLFAKLPSSLSSLRLDMEGTSATDLAVQDLTSKMPASLETLWLSFAGTGVTDQGLMQLTSALPASLSNMGLCLSKLKVTDLGAIALSKKIATVSQALELRFSETSLGNEGLAALSVALNGGVQALILSLSSTQISSAGLAMLSRHLPSAMRSLTLHCSKTRISDVGVALLALQLQSTIQSLTLDFEACEDLTDQILPVLAARLPANLSTLSLNVAKTAVSDLGLSAFASELPATLETLELQLAGSKASAGGFASPGELQKWQSSSGVECTVLKDNAQQMLLQLNRAAPLMNACQQKDATGSGVVDARFLKDALGQLEDLSDLERTRADRAIEELMVGEVVGYVDFVGRFASSSSTTAAS